MTHLNDHLALIILDGWGHAESKDGNALAQAHTPYYDSIARSSPRSLLAASGEAVGLPRNMPGNAEAAHMNIGAGRPAKTIGVRVAESVRDGSFFKNEVLCGKIADAVRRDGRIHLVGTLSSSEVHGSAETLYALLRMTKEAGAYETLVHPILDGRDVPARTADIFVEALEAKMAEIGGGRIGSLCGRYYAMDSEGNWERTARAYTMLMHGEGERADDAVKAVRNSFLRGISEEFLSPVVMTGTGAENGGLIREADLVIFFNHRADTMRQLVRSVAVPGNAEQRVDSVCIAEYDASFGLPFAFQTGEDGGGLSSVLAEFGVPNYRISETDRIAHVGRILDCETPVDGRFEHILDVGTLSSEERAGAPEMKSFKIADRLFRLMESEPAGLFIVNFPAPGLAAESGDLTAAVEAVQYVDTCLGGVLRAVNARGATAIVTGSHGNCEQMITGEGKPDPQATSNPVPFHIIGREGGGVRPEGSLCDIAPTMLGLMGIPVPQTMTGRDLRIA